MEDKCSTSKLLKMGIVIPIIAYFLLDIILGVITMFAMRTVTLHNANSTSLIYYFSLGTMVLCYISAYLYTRKKAWGYMGFLISFLSVMIPVYIIDGNWGMVFWMMQNVVRSSVLGILLFLSYDWFRKAQKQKELEKQNLQSELKLLKNQLNPHFLFNTLNNIDSLIHSNPDKASTSLVEMSEMMRYMIYETNAPEVLLSRELAHIENYLSLQRLQYDNPELVSYHIEGNPERILIAPMLFIPFIENAFKHCTDKKAKAAIRFCLRIQEREIRFEACNRFDPSERINKDASSGIGLDVVKRRLEYLYPNKYDLQICEKKGYFDVSLKIRLA